MNKTIQQLKQEMNKPTITKLYINGNRNVVTYSEEYQSFDIPLTVKELIEELQTSGANRIQVVTASDIYDYESEEQAYKIMKRLDKICNQSGYINAVKIQFQYLKQDGLAKHWIELSGNLLRSAA